MDLNVNLFPMQRPARLKNAQNLHLHNGENKKETWEDFLGKIM